MNQDGNRKKHGKITTKNPSKGEGAVQSKREDVLIDGNSVKDLGRDGIVITCCDGAVVEHHFVRGANSRPNGKYHAGVPLVSMDSHAIIGDPMFVGGRCG